MVFTELPLFMENDEWSRYDEEQGIVVLTDKAPEHVVESYNEYIKNYKERRAIGKGVYEERLRKRRMGIKEEEE